MSRRRLNLPVVLGGLLLALSIAGVTAAITVGGGGNETLSAAASTMESQLLRQAVVVNGAGTPSADRFHELGRPFDLALAEALAATRPDSTERRLLITQGDLATRWRSAAIRAIAASAAADRGASDRAALLDRFAQSSAELRARLLRERDAAGRRSRQVVLLLVICLSMLTLAGASTAAVRGWRRHTARAIEARRSLLEDRRHGAEQEEFSRALQGARTEREAQRMLKRQLDRTLSDSSATVLNRNNSDNRLEAVTAVPANSPLAMTIPDAEPGDCLAVRFGQPHDRAAGSAPLMGCELCGGVPGSVTCVPSLVGGEVIGSVLVETPDPLDEGGKRRLAQAVANAAPVLSSMRNLQLAETRASTDALTGLPNRRSAEETLKRILAQAARSNTPCAVAMFDLDHFKKVNDVYGHDKGDQLLAAVGDIAGASVRASDFVARIGGEEFLLVLPDTDVEGALQVCDKLRTAIFEIRLPGPGPKPSASFGLAMFPTDGADAEGLLRGADRGLYAAKAAGRNCVKALRSLEDDNGSSVIHADTEPDPESELAPVLAIKTTSNGRQA